MGHRRAVRALALWFFTYKTSAWNPMYRGENHRRDAISIGQRESRPPMSGPPPALSAHATTSTGVLTYITPSPGATPVAVTTQSQVVTSYVPQFTLCELLPMEFIPVSPLSVSSQPTNMPYRNYSISIPAGNGTCTTIFSPTATMVCATTLTALAKRYTVTNCNEDLTFSTKYGHDIVTAASTRAADATGSNVSASVLCNTAMITPAPSIETLTTFFLAPWQQLTAGDSPSNVDLKVCRTFQNGTVECIREYQVWETSLVTLLTTTVTSISISTTIHGSSQILVETFVANVTEQLTTFSMSTTMTLEYQTQFTTTHSRLRAILTSTGPTVYETLTVQKAPESGRTTSTITIYRTSTIYDGTSTITLPSPSASGLSATWIAALPV